ncbi:hypothetical protein ACO0SA_004423 [Hanseniaspora valbyensis]
MVSSSNKIGSTNSKQTKHLQSFEEELDNLDIQSLDFDLEDFINHEDDLDLNNDKVTHNQTNDINNNSNNDNNINNSTYELHSLRNSVIDNIHTVSTNEREVRPSTTPILDYKRYPSNSIMNNKYNAITFIPIILYEQFKFFFNLYFLLVALSQAIPQLRIGYLSSYVVPLVFVLSITMGKEALDDLQRLLNINTEAETSYQKPIFIKTDQLDGETDWKLRTSINLTQSETLSKIVEKTCIICEPPNKEIYKFEGKLIFNENSTTSLTCDNTLWANTIIASQGAVYGVVVYTGKETRQQMNTTSPSVKTGLLELEINKISKLLCLTVLILSIILVLFKGFDNSDWYLDIMRYLILFSTIIPVSLRVNLDLGKSVYSYQIEKDKEIKDTIVRTSTIPEDLGRISYLLSDKTGTLTQNDMEMKKLQLGDLSYSYDSFDLIEEEVKKIKDINTLNSNNKLVDTILTLALCHNVTPTFEEDQGESSISYQAASPDEIAIVRFTESVGLFNQKR